MSRIYLLLGSDQKPIGRAVPAGPILGENLQVRVLDGMAEAVAEHQLIIIMGEENGDGPTQCCLLERREDVISLRKMMSLNPELRRDLRIPVRFDSFIYPLEGSFKGRKSMRSVDLSCGGIAFYSDPGMDVADTLEVVIPVTTNPLILKMRILRRQELNNGKTYYAAKFVGLLEDEENLICEAVFGIQLRLGREKEMRAI